MARIRNFPKSYKTLARQTSGLVGGRVSTPVPVVSPAPPAAPVPFHKIRYEVGDLVQGTGYKGNKGIITKLTNNRYSGDELYLVLFWLPNGERREIAVTHYDVGRLKTAQQYGLEKAQAKAKALALAILIQRERAELGAIPFNPRHVGRYKQLQRQAVKQRGRYSYDTDGFDPEVEAELERTSKLPPMPAPPTPPAAPARFASEQRVTCWAGAGHVVSVGTDPEEGFDRVYRVQIDGDRLKFINESSLSAETQPVPNRKLALAKAKAKALALAIAIAREREGAAVTYSAPITPIQTISPAPVVPDYDLSREPGDPWQIPEAWATRLPENHYNFMRVVTAFQRPDGKQKKRGYGPVQIGDSCGIREMRLVRELTELSTVHLARTTLLPLRRTPGADFGPFLERLESLYRQQFSLADLKTSTTLLNQQYSTPSPLSGILGEWVARSKGFGPLLGAAYEGAMERPAYPLVLEPTAGNGLLTVRFDPKIVAVNELEDTRFRHLFAQDYAVCTGYDAADKRKVDSIGVPHLYPAVITNPPFGSTDTQRVRHRYGSESYLLNGWEHVIAAHAVNRLADEGRAAIIIGGHHQFNANGKLVGRDWIFFNYLYHHFHVAHVLQLDAHKLYARQGATWPIRVILLDGVKREPAGHAPLGKAGAPLPILTTFAQVAQTIGLIS